MILTSHIKHGLYTTTNIELAEISNKIFSQPVRTNLEIAVPLALACHMRALRLMHKRLGHISEDRIEEIMRNDLINLPNEHIDTFYRSHHCDTCLEIRLEQQGLAKSSTWFFKGHFKLTV